MITIGLPKGLFYFEYGELWEEFFKSISCQVVVSANTNKRILDDGVKCCSNETCLPVKVFHGHVFHLKDCVDYVFIPRYTSIDKNEYTCPKFCGLPDMARLNLKRKVPVLEVQVHMDLFPSKIVKSLSDIAKILGLNNTYVQQAFRRASEEYSRHNQMRHAASYTQKTLTGKGSIAVLGHPYMIYDDYLSMGLIQKLVNKGYTVFTPKDIDSATKRKNAYPYQGKVFWNVGFELLGSAFTFAQDKNLRGLIYLTPFACGVDAFVVEFIERRFQTGHIIPFLKLTVDEHTGEAGFDTRIEAFLDTVGG